MEFLRFGSSIPGSYWGCCAVCIIQNFKVDPKQKASIQLVDGDGGVPIMHPEGGSMFAGPTYEDIFRQRIRIGTFSSREMPNHAFFAVLTESQVNYNPGKKWLKILKEEGFEFIRTVDNSVYTGQTTMDKASGHVSSHKNYIFGLFRNIGAGAVDDPFLPPKAWTDLPAVIPEIVVADSKAINEAHQQYQLDRWKNNPAPKFLTKQEVIDAGAPVTLAGQRSRYPQQLESQRESLLKTAQDAGDGTALAVAGDPFAYDGEEDYEDDCDFEDCESF